MSVCNRAEQNVKGFTLVELMIVLALFLIVFSLSNVSLSGLIAKHSSEEFAEAFISEAHRHQMRAMLGEQSLDGDHSYGIKFLGDRYELFSGTYQAGANENIVVSLPSDLQFTNSTFVNNEVLFTALSGEVQNYASQSASIVITNTTTNQSTPLVVNQIGVFTSP